MRSLIFAFGLMTSYGVSAANAFETQDQARFGLENALNVLTIVSTADIDFFAPMISSYVDANPSVAVEYTVASSSEVMRALDDEGLAFDIAISSAMDLQTKLVNDGLAQVHISPVTQSLPTWAAWNDMVFAFTQEPAAIVLSKQAFGDLPIPQNRQDLIATMREHPDRFRGKIGTYDVRRSGLGYLFATQDARASETYWRLMEVMGSLETQLYCCSSDMIDDVVSGDLAIAYNVLGSYAVDRADRAAFRILLPSDFTTVMLRTVLIPIRSQRPELAGDFVDHLLELTQQNGTFGPNAFDQKDTITLRRIKLGPALLVYLDRFKNLSFIKEWESAVLQ